MSENKMNLNQNKLKPVFIGKKLPPTISPEDALKSKKTTNVLLKIDKDLPDLPVDVPED